MQQRERRCAEREGHARALRIDPGREQQLGAARIAHHSAHRERARMVVGANRDSHTHCVGCSSHRRIEAEGGRIARRGRTEREARLAPAAGCERHALLALATQIHAVSGCPHLHARRAARALVHHHSRRERIAGAGEARQRGPRHERPRDEQRRRAAAISVTSSHRHRHHAERREVVRQLRCRSRTTAGIGDDGAEEEGRGAEARTEHVAAIRPAAAAR